MRVNLKGLVVLALVLVVVALATQGPNTWFAHLAEAATTAVILMALVGTYFRDVPRRH